MSLPRLSRIWHHKSALRERPRWKTEDRFFLSADANLPIDFLPGGEQAGPEGDFLHQSFDWTILRNNLYAEVVLRFAQFAFKTGRLVSAGRVPISVEDFLQGTVPALIA
jgi:hypothetical protein